MMFARLFVIFSFVILAACGSRGSQPQSYTSISSLASSGSQHSMLGLNIDDNETYQIGTEMGKKPVTEAILAAESEAFQRAARATAHTGNATAFYLGYFNGHHVMASNYHVYERASSCLGQTLRFPHLGDRRFVCKTFFGTWSDIDLSLFAIEVTNESDAQALAAVAGNFAFGAEIERGQELLTVGFGIANNRRQNMMYNQDSDCKVFSQDNDFRFLADPDELNPGPYKAWSMAVGCDVSHGDSGSAMVDRATGKVLGIVWTGKIPKNPKIREPGYTDRIFAEHAPEVWTELSLAVPAPKMADFLGEVVADPKTPAVTVQTLQALLAE